MDNKIKIGDYVYFKSLEKDSIFTKSGMVLNINNDRVSILEKGCYSSRIEIVSINNIRPISDKENIIDEIKNFYNEKIKKQEYQLKSIKRSDYKEEIKSKYTLLQKEILNTCRNMLETTDDYEFEQKLKAICQKKKQLFSIECESMNDARKFNGEVKYNIKELIEKRENCIKNLDSSIDYLKGKIS